MKGSNVQDGEDGGRAGGSAREGKKTRCSSPTCTAQLCVTGTDLEQSLAKPHERKMRQQTDKRYPFPTTKKMSARR